MDPPVVPALEAAWTNVYGLLSQTLIAAAKAAENL